jgi:hypothetical protein
MVYVIVNENTTIKGELVKFLKLQKRFSKTTKTKIAEKCD